MVRLAAPDSCPSLRPAGRCRAKRDGGVSSESTSIKQSLKTPLRPDFIGTPPRGAQGEARKKTGCPLKKTRLTELSKFQTIILLLALEELLDRVHGRTASDRPDGFSQRDALWTYLDTVLCVATVVDPART